MGTDLALLIAAVAISGANLLGVLWLVLRLRSRGVRARSVTTAEEHEHQFAEKNSTKYGDTKWHCNVDGCGEPAPDKKNRGM